MIFVIGGITGSGKTNLAFKLAKEINGVIINADAFAVYKELNIGTAKPTDKELGEVNNYMFNIVSASDKFSIFEYQRMVRQIIEKYKQLDRPIIIVGGSGLYIRSVLYDYTFSEQKITDTSKYDELTNEILYEQLLKKDPQSAAVIHQNNRKRVIRALSIFEENKESKSSIEKRQNKDVIYPHIFINLDIEQKLLDEKLRERVVTMFKKGLRKEVQYLSENFRINAQALQAIGYKEIINEPDESDDYLIDLITMRTRQYAKRQRTFFKNQFQSEWFDDPQLAFNYLIKKYEEIKNVKSN